MFRCIPRRNELPRVTKRRMRRRGPRSCTKTKFSRSSKGLTTSTLSNRLHFWKHIGTSSTNRLRVRPWMICGTTGAVNGCLHMLSYNHYRCWSLMLQEFVSKKELNISSVKCLAAVYRGDAKTRHERAHGLVLEEAGRSSAYPRTLSRTAWKVCFDARTAGRGHSSGRQTTRS